ncbi:MAG: sensor histidine kinase [bacterium]
MTAARALAGPLLRRVAPLAVLAGLVVAVVLPALYQRLSLDERAAQAGLWARQVASRAAVLASERPQLWAYDRVHLGTVVRPLVSEPVFARVRLDTPAAERVFEAGPAGRVGEVSAWAVVQAGEQVAGRVEVRLPAADIRNQVKLLWISAGIAGLLLAAGLFFLPMAAVRRGDARNDELWAALEEANAHLEARVEARTAELKHRERQLSELGARLVAVQEEERARISRDLHDDLGQSLTGLRLRLTTLEALVPAEGPARRHVEAAMGAVDAAVEQVRHLAHGLRPPALDALGLPAALRAHAERWAASAGLALTLDLAADEPPPGPAEVLFRVAQEALTNVARHAQATRVAVVFGRADDGWRLVVEDDGRGLAPGRVGGLGLVGARERAEQAGGYLDVEPGAAGGVRLLLWLPEDLS